MAYGDRKHEHPLRTFIQPAAVFQFSSSGRFKQQDLTEHTKKAFSLLIVFIHILAQHYFIKQWNSMIILNKHIHTETVPAECIERYIQYY